MESEKKSLSIFCNWTGTSASGRSCLSSYFEKLGGAYPVETEMVKIYKTVSFPNGPDFELIEEMARNTVKQKQREKHSEKVYV
jgi:hypothetical protein